MVETSKKVFEEYKVKCFFQLHLLAQVTNTAIYITNQVKSAGNKNKPVTLSWYCCTPETAIVVTQLFIPGTYTKRKLICA